MNDHQLLRQYLEHASQQAFATLVERHVGIVYSAANRQLRDRHLAEDVTQAVFLSLARRGHKLRERTVLSGWLLATTRYLCMNARKIETRRNHHERQAAALGRTAQEPADAWERLAPDLDEALADLPAASRDAVLLRYFEGLGVPEVAARLRISHDAAKQRLSRALDRMRRFFARRGMAVPTATLSTLLTANAVQAAPAGLAAATSASCAKLATCLAIQQGAVPAVAWMLNAKAALTAVLAVAVVGSTAAVVQRARLRRDSEPAAVQLAAAGGGWKQPSDHPWRREFERVYRPAGGEVLKRVPPPFIPERDAFFNDVDPSDNAVHDGVVVFAFDGRVQLRSTMRRPPTVPRVLRQCVGLPSYKLELSPADRRRLIPGDWVVRPGAGEDKLMDAFGRIIRQSGWGVTFEKRQVEREVVVARGRYAAPKEAEILLALDDEGWRRGSGIGGVDDFLVALGELTDTELVNEAQPADTSVVWRNHIVGHHLAAADVDRLLENVAKQTGLRFARERRVTSRWVAVPVAK